MSGALAAHHSEPIRNRESPCLADRLFGAANGGTASRSELPIVDRGTDPKEGITVRSTTVASRHDT